MTRRNLRIRDATERKMNYLYLGIAIVAEVIGTSFMKQADGFTRLLPSLAVCSPMRWLSMVSR